MSLNAELIAYFTFFGLGELAIYRYLNDAIKFPVSSKEKTTITNNIENILKKKPEEMSEIILSIKNDLANNCKYFPIKQMMQFVFGLSEDSSFKVAAHYGTRLSPEQKNIIDLNLNKFQMNYIKGYKKESYDSIANIFEILHIKEENVKLDKNNLYRDLEIASKKLADGEPQYLYDVLSSHVQRKYDDEKILLYVNALNDIIYRVKSKLSEGPTYYKFLKDISKYVHYASFAIEKDNSLLLYESYKKILDKAKWRINQIDRFTN